MTISAEFEFSELAIAEICRSRQVKELSLFDSAARGELGPESDFDLLVDFPARSTPQTAGSVGAHP